MASANKHFLSSMTNLRFRVAFPYSNRTQQPMNSSCLAGNQPTSGRSLVMKVQKLVHVPFYASQCFYSVGIFPTS